MSENKTLTTLVRDITYYYIKHFYDKKLKEEGLTTIPDDEVVKFVNSMYEIKKKDLENYIKTSLKETLGEDKYPKMQVNLLLIEMFQDPDFAKNRVINEIITYQNNLSK